MSEKQQKLKGPDISKSYCIDIALITDMFGHRKLLIMFGKSKREINVYFLAFFL